MIGSEINWAMLATVGYGLGAFLFLILTVAFLVGRLESWAGKWLIAVAFTTLSWLTTAALATLSRGPLLWQLQSVLETLSVGLWFLFLAQHFRADPAAVETKLPLVSYARKGLLAVMAVVMVADVAAFQGAIAPPVGLQVHFIGHSLLAVIGLILVEQIYRNADEAQRWALKFLCLAAGVLAAYQLFLYSDAILFRRLDEQLWIGRGVVLCMLTIPLGIGAARGVKPARRIYISRDAVLHGVALTGSGIYLLTVAGVGYLVREGVGTWGTVAQTAFLVGAILLLLSLLFSGQVRAKTRVFLSKHLFAYRYDHRAEWLRLITTLSDEREPDIRVRALKALAGILDCRCAWLWTSGGGAGFTCVADWNRRPCGEPVVSGDDALVEFLRDRSWVIDLAEMQHSPDRYDGVRAPTWVDCMEGAWVIVPLIHMGDLIGFAVLGESKSRSDLNWEDHDLLRTAGREISSHLALLAANDRLLRARQFEAFNRLSAYVVHDLKNLSAQLSLIYSNAEDFRNDPEFIDDTLDTVRSAANKVDHMVTDLRKGLRPEAANQETVSLRDVVGEVVRHRGCRKPVPTLVACEADLRVSGVAHRLQKVIAHVVQNAQEATAEDGNVDVSLHQLGDEACIEVTDNGCGMDAHFIETRLFQPFDTTKGNAGMGIGVYETKQTIEEFGGRLAVDATPGLGTTFRLYLPIADGAAVNEPARIDTRRN